VLARTQGGGSATVIPTSVTSPAERLGSRFGNGIAWARGAIVDRRPSPLPLSSITDADGRHGVTVRYLTSSGEELAKENRAATQIVSFDGESMMTRAGVVEMSFRWSPATSGGETPLAVIGLCDYEVTVDDVPV
jgi:beta-glucosidase